MCLVEKFKHISADTMLDTKQTVTIKADKIAAFNKKHAIKGFFQKQ